MKIPNFAKHYAGASDEELIRWSDDVLSLMPDARKALRLEMKRRGIPDENVDWTAQAVPEQPKVSGWLWFYCVGAVILHPIWLVMTLFRGPSLLVIFLLPYSTLVIGSGMFLWRRNPKGLIWVRWSFLYIATIVCLMLPLSLLKDGWMSLIDYVIDVAIGSIPLILWWRYFRKSKHVREIYGCNMEGLRRRSKIGVAGLENQPET